MSPLMPLKQSKKASFIGDCGKPLDDTIRTSSSASNRDLLDWSAGGE
jgi:hypothetical protein